MEHESDESYVALPGSDHFLLRSFFIYDLALMMEQKEEDDQTETIVYFYPPEVDTRKQLWLIGSVHMISNFSKNFTKSRPRVVSLEREKMAIKEVGDYVLVLTGNLNQPDTSLYLDLEKILGAFNFFYGSFDIIKRNVGGDHLKFLSVMKQLGKEVIPYIRQYENEKHPSFDKLPFSVLPPGYNRNFLAASELLTSLKSEPDNLGGCVLYNESVLCTHLEPLTSSYILTKVESMVGLSKLQGNGDICMPVFVNISELERLREGRTPLIEISEDARSQLPESYFSKNHTGEFVGLYILSLAKIAIAVLMNLPALYDERHINKTRLMAQSRLHNLELKLYKMPKGTEQQSPGFNFLTFDKASKNLVGSSLEMSSEVDVKFHIGTRTQHEIFSSKPEVSTIVLRDYTGVVLGKRIFDSEVYYQHRNPPPPANANKTPLLNKDISRLEEIARESLQEMSISLI